MRYCRKARRRVIRNGWVEPKSWNGRNISISACACGSASARRSGATSAIPRVSPTWSSAPSTWREPCRKIEADELARDWPELDLLDLVEPAPATPIERARPPRTRRARCPALPTPTALRRVGVRMGCHGRLQRFCRRSRRIIWSASRSSPAKAPAWKPTAFPCGPCRRPHQLGRDRRQPSGRARGETSNGPQSGNRKLPGAVRCRGLRLLRHLIGAISGSSWRAAPVSLKDRLGSKSCSDCGRSPCVCGYCSKPFDGRGWAARHRLRRRRAGDMDFWIWARHGN